MDTQDYLELQRRELEQFSPKSKCRIECIFPMVVFWHIVRRSQPQSSHQHRLYRQLYHHRFSVQETLVHHHLWKKAAVRQTEATKINCFFTLGNYNWIWSLCDDNQSLLASYGRQLWNFLCNWTDISRL